MFFHQFRILSFKNVFSWAFQLPYLFSVNLLTNCSHKSQFFIFCFWRKIQPNIWPIHPRPQFLFPFWNQRIFDLCCSHWRLIYLPHQIRSEVHHELQILPNTKLGDKNRSPPGQILRRMGYICPRPWRGLVKLKISWISNIKRNYHRSENEPLTDSYHEHFYVEKGFKVSDIDPRLPVLERILGPFDTADNLTPRTIWHFGQFDTIMASRTIWHHEGKEDNLTPRTIWHHHAK